MNKVTDKQELSSSLKRVNEEAQSIYQSLMNDLTSSRVKIISLEMMPCYEVKEVFDIKTRFEALFTSNWSSKTLSDMNSGMSGLILDEFDKDNIFSQVVFEKFFSTLNTFLSKNKVLKALLLQRTIEEIEKKYKNKYKLVDIKEVFSNFVRRADGNIAPNIGIEIQLERT